MTLKKFVPVKSNKDNNNSKTLRKLKPVDKLIKENKKLLKSLNL